MIEELSSRRTLRTAFERVQENGGCRGADGVTIGCAVDASTLPLLRFDVPKAQHAPKTVVVGTGPVTEDPEVYVV